MHRQARDLPGSLGALLQRCRLRAIEGNDPAVAHLPVTEVDEANGLPQMEVRARRTGRGAGRSTDLQRSPLVDTSAAGCWRPEGFEYARVNGW
jgi:hypothetical protein